MPLGKRTEVRTPSLTGERRHLTAFFCDLVNSTSLATRLDLEEWLGELRIIISINGKSFRLEDKRKAVVLGAPPKAVKR